jgi:N-acetylneuraminate synthase
VEWVDSFQNPLALLHCILNYPTEDSNANLGMIRALKEHFPDKIVGYSDHTMPKEMKNLEIATFLGSAIIEKHFTHNKNLPGNDHYHAMDKEDLKVFIHNIENSLDIIGKQYITSLDSEKSSRLNARRSLVAKNNISIGEKITEKDITWKRPAFGISPKHFEYVIGKTAKIDINKDDILTWNMFN